MPISSTIEGPLGVLSQQGIDAYGIQREIGIRQTTNLPEAGRTYYTFDFALTIYMHPGIRAQFPVVTKWKDRLKRPVAVRKLAGRLDQLARRSERDWFIFHNFALHVTSLKGIHYLLRRFGV